MSKHEAIYRKDYKHSSYLIRTTKLDFALSDEATIVKSKLDFYRNPEAEKTDNLTLNGVDLELLEITLNGTKPEYEICPDGLILKGLPDEFVLETSVKIYPQKNTTLNGLYQSGGNFCTQCEPHGFRHITYFLDRPDILSVFTVKITADFTNYPYLLSNGNLIEQKKGEAIWYDPAPKPCYLFALVAGDFAVKRDNFTTSSGNKVALEIYTEKHNSHKVDFAMKSLKKAFKWDEERFGLEYDLAVYQIVAVDDFNMGAMENKGLNIFNSACVLADEATATDEDFIHIEAVIGHEYFHNWTGNRITCRDWFELSLKEGLTVFRDQEFSADLHSRSIKRIDDVIDLRTLQFAEDASPNRHAVRPKSYIEVNNFYTSTVYEKGAELIRMLHTFLGEANFQAGMQLYFQRFDGQAVRIDDFVAAMADANDFDFTNFMAWYDYAGTPKITVSTDFDAKSGRYSATFKQVGEVVFCLPIRYGLLDKNGEDVESGVLTLSEAEQTYHFEGLDSAPTPSWLRDFSAPIILKSDLSIEQKIFLIEHDKDAFNRWDNAQNLWSALILSDDKIDEDALFLCLENILLKSTDFALTSQIMRTPTMRFLYQQVDEIKVFEIEQKRQKVVDKIAERFAVIFANIYHKLNDNKPHSLDTNEVGARLLKNTCLYYLSQNSDFKLANQQFSEANCMSDKLRAFAILLDAKNQYQDAAIEAFYQDFKHDTIALDKWFSVISFSKTSDVSTVKTLMQHQKFNFNTPNQIRAVVGSFTQNHTQFHNLQGYDFLTETIIKLNKINPQIGARLTLNYNNWQRFEPKLATLQKQQLVKISKIDNLAPDIFEIVNTALNATKS